MSETQQDIEETMFSLLHERGSDKTICPSEVARHIVGNDETKWRLLMKPIRAIAVDLAHKGEIVIKRKGKKVDPDDFKGVYRLGLP